MPLIVIIGAGNGMGRSIAEVFGAKGFSVALVSRNSSHLQPIVQQLNDKGIMAAIFQGDITDPGSIKNAIANIKEQLGDIDVLEFSPADTTLPMVNASGVTQQNAQAQIDFYIHGAIAVVENVLPDMLAKGSGTILFTTGGSAVHPNPVMGNIGPATAWLRNWALALHQELLPKGVKVGYLAISAWIGRHPLATPELIAPLHWELFTEKDTAEKEYKV